MAAAAAAGTLERLEALLCPPPFPVPPLEPAQALQLLCTPSSRRLALLEQLCCRVHPPLAHRLAALRSAPEEARLRELARLGADLMLCRAEDVGLLEGTAPPERQLEFIRDLLDAATPPPESGGSFESGVTMTLAASELLRALLETPEGGAAVRPPPPPEPPNFREEGDSPPPPRIPPGGGGPDLEAALGAAREQLELLEAQSAPVGGSADSGGPPPDILPLLGGAGGELAALATAFGETELRDPWGGGEKRGGPPRVTPPPRRCAPPAPPVRQGMKELVQSLGVVAQLEETVTEVTQLAGGGQQQTMATHTATLRQCFGDAPQILGGGPRQD